MIDQREMAKAEFIAEQLSSYEPGYLPEPLFFAISHLAVLTGVEVVPVLRGTGDILLVRRPDDDPYFSGELHFPGTILLASDQTILQAIQRVLVNELLLSKEAALDVFNFFAFSRISKTKRGSQLSHVHVAAMDYVPFGFQAYSPRNLPDNVLDHHRYIINKLNEDGHLIYVNYGRN